jgi:hypothetical protein
VFAFVCFGVGLLVLRRFDRERKAQPPV